jgi:hypothetical protein
VVTRGRDGLFRVHEELWDTRDWAVVGQAFWSPAGHTSITDTLEHALQLAREAMPRRAASRDRSEAVEQGDEADER